MRQFVIDELSPMERDNIESWLNRNLTSGPVDGLFWLELEDNQLSDAQKGEEHKDHGPWYMAIEVSRDKAIFELLVRSQSNLHCSCIAYATKEQREIMLGIMDQIISEEMISA